jgi:hypothetical protein
MNDAAMSIYIRIFEGRHVFSSRGYISGNGVTGLYGNSVSPLRTVKVFSKVTESF